MKIIFTLFSGLMLLAGTRPAFSGTNVKTAEPAQGQAIEQKDAKTAEFKNILVKLVRQDEYLDEAIETLNSAGGRMTPHGISAMGLNLKIISGSLAQVSALNKAEFSTISPASRLSTYTNAILSYSRKINLKAGQINTLAARMAARNKKAAVRDSVISSKGGKKTRGKKITQLIAEQKALDALSTDARKLLGAARSLNATSKWLYIASK